MPKKSLYLRIGLSLLFTLAITFAFKLSTVAQADLPAIRAASVTTQGIAFYSIHDDGQLEQIGVLPPEFVMYDAKKDETQWEITNPNYMVVSPDGQDVAFSARHLIGTMDFYSEENSHTETAYYSENGVFIFHGDDATVEEVWKWYMWAGTIVEPIWSPDGNYIMITGTGLDGGDPFPDYLRNQIYARDSRRSFDVRDGYARWVSANELASGSGSEIYITSANGDERHKVATLKTLGYEGFFTWSDVNKRLYFTIGHDSTYDEGYIEEIYSADLQGNLRLEKAISDLVPDNVAFATVVDMHPNPQGVYVLTETYTEKDDLYWHILQIQRNGRSRVVWENHPEWGWGYEPAKDALYSSTLSPDANYMAIVGDVEPGTLDQQLIVVDLKNGKITHDNFTVAGDTCKVQWLNDKQLVFDQIPPDDTTDYWCQGRLWSTPVADVWVLNIDTGAIQKLNGTTHVWLLNQTEN